MATCSERSGQLNGSGGVLVNVYCENKGWLFRDLLALYAAAGAVVSSEPLPQADVWICVRTDEWRRCPDPSRLVLQVHDLWSHEWPKAVGALVLSHYDQQPSSSCRASLLRPLGPLRSMVPLERRNDRPFTVGWVGRPAQLRLNEVKSPAPLLAALEQCGVPARVILAGSGLGSHAAAAAAIPGLEVEHRDRSTFPVERYSELYASMDVLCITSTTEAGPLPLFEALACGTPVLSTPVGWAPRLLNGENGWVYGHGELAAALEDARRARFAAPEAIRASLGDIWLDGAGGWIEQTLDLAQRVAT